MTTETFRAFVQHASGSMDMPNDYVATKLAVMKMFPKLAGWGEMAEHGAEIAGLGILARPTIQKMRGKQVSEQSTHAHELAGLGTLAAPSAVKLFSHLRK